MKTERKILVAFILNLIFAVFEFVGGVVTGSVAITSDAVHDIGDAMSIGFSYFMERKSKKAPDSVYTYGYGRYSAIGGLITTVILLIGSIAVTYNAVLRILNPVKINYDGMILFAVVGVVINFTAAWFTRDGNSFNQKSVNLHMLEDVLGWVVVLVGAIVMRVTDVAVLDPIMSVGVAAFIFINAAKNLKQIFELFLEKVPGDVDFEEIKDCVLEIDGVLDVHHVHLWSVDGHNNCATMHVVTDDTTHEIKTKIRDELAEHNIAHVTLELEGSNECCRETGCEMKQESRSSHHHHHHHHH